MTENTQNTAPLHGTAEPAASVHASEGPNTPTAEKPTIGSLVAKVTAQFSSLIRDEITYTKLEAMAKVKKIGIGGVLLAVAGLLALYMLGMLLFAAAYGLAEVLPVWAAFLIVAGALLLIIVILALIGVGRIKASKEHDIDPSSGIKKDVDVVKKGLKK